MLIALVAAVAGRYSFFSWHGVGWPTVAEWLATVLDSGAEGPGFKSQPRRCRVTVLGKLFTPVVPLFTKQRNWYQPSYGLRG